MSNLRIWKITLENGVQDFYTSRKKAEQRAQAYLRYFHQCPRDNVKVEKVGEYMGNVSAYNPETDKFHSLWIEVVDVF